MGAVHTLKHRSRRLAALMPEGARISVPGHLPPGHDWIPPRGVNPAAAAYAADAVAPALAAMEANIPMERDPGSDVWEALTLDVAGGKPFVRARNLMGLGESLHLFQVCPGFDAELENWAACRRDHRPERTSWDAARARRIVLPETSHGGGTRPGYIDPGAVRLLEIAAAIGATTRFCCEGHPRAAYLRTGDDAASARLVAALGAMGWLTPEGGTGLGAYMPRVADVAERDANWRRTVDGLERRLGLGQDDGREALAALSLNQAAAEYDPAGGRPAR